MYAEWFLLEVFPFWFEFMALNRVLYMYNLNVQVHNGTVDADALRPNGEGGGSAA